MRIQFRIQNRIKNKIELEYKLGNVHSSQHLLKAESGKISILLT